MYNVNEVKQLVNVSSVLQREFRYNSEQEKYIKVQQNN